MKPSILLAAVALTVCSLAPAFAAPVTVPFGCDARAGKTCYFELFLGPHATRMVQLLAGMKESFPGIQIGQDHYCVDMSGPPGPKCDQKVIKADYNN
jgi:hypothetical protein